MVFTVAYERLPESFVVCCYLRHMYKECRDGVHPPLALVFKNLRPSWFKGAGRGPGGGRGRGRGHGGRNGHGPGRTQEEASGESEYEDPDAYMHQAELNKKRASELAATVDPVAAELAITAMSAQGKTPALPSPQIPSSPSSRQEQNRPRTSNCSR